MTQTATAPNRHDRQQTDDILCKKKDLAIRFACSTRQIELMSNDGRLPRPFYIGDASPRWRRADIDAWLERLATEAQTAKGGES